MAEATVKKPSKASTVEAVKRYLQIDDRVDELSKEVDALKREQKLCLATATAWLGDDDEAKLPGGLKILAYFKQQYVAWKDELIRITSADYALELARNAPQKRLVKIEAA